MCGGGGGGGRVARGKNYFHDLETFFFLFGQL
jgi:hypothetical protein